MKATPGPWTLNERVKTAVDAGEKHIAMVNIYKSGNPAVDVYGEEHRANALLIVSAPSLLAALQEAVTFAKDELKEIGVCDHAVGICVCGIHRMIQGWEDIITKATGDAP